MCVNVTTTWHSLSFGSAPPLYPRLGGLAHLGPGDDLAVTRDVWWLHPSEVPEKRNLKF